MFSREKAMKINLCCGADYREEYLNVDFSSVGSDGKPIKSDFNCDIAHGLPWDSNSADEIIFRESLEHFNRHQGLAILKDIFRVLKPGGTLDLSVPNAPKQIRLILAFCNRTLTLEQFTLSNEPPWSYFKFHDDLMGATHKNSKGDSHLTLYTRPYLEMILHHVGFHIDKFEEKDSFYVIARK